MSQLIALIIAIALGVVVTAIGYVFLGDSFTNQSVKAESQKILVQAEQIEAAMIAYKINNGGVIKLGESDPNGDGNFEDNDIFRHLIFDEYLKEDINGTLTDQTLSWHLEGAGPDQQCGTADDTSDTCTIQRVIPDPEQCLEANHQKNRLPEDGVYLGYVMRNGTVITTGTGGNSSEGVPICGETSAEGIACCVTL
jgi:type II secretory pathway pseudopilin PulG